jgi:hypothetical protein
MEIPMRGWMAGACVGAALLGACTYAGGDIEEPVRRSAQWFSYVGGDDLRAECEAGRPARYRFVYNATWEEQVRTYDVDRIPGDGALLRVRVLRGGARILQFWIVDQLGAPVAPTTVVRDVKLSETQYLELIRAVEASGFGEPAPAGLQLPSWDFFWVVSACADGRFHFNAWRQRHPGWDRITFDRLLFAADTTEVALRRPPEWPRSWTEADYRVSRGLSMNNRDTRRSDGFQMAVGQDGLRGNLRAF